MTKFLDIDGLRHYHSKTEALFAGTIAISGQTLKLVSKSGAILNSITLPTQTYSLASASADGLMSSAHFTKVEGVSDGATKTENSTVNGNIKIDGVETPVYKHPTSAAGALTASLYKITTDANGHVIAGAKVVKTDITALGIPAQDTTYKLATGSANGLMSSAHFTKLENIAENAQVNVIESITVNGQPLTISAKGVNIDLNQYAKKSDIANAVIYRGSVNAFADLPTQGLKHGDMYNVVNEDKAHGISAGTNVIWLDDKKTWDATGAFFNIDPLTTAEIDTVF